MSEKSVKRDINLEYDAKHSGVATGILWYALCEALADIGRSHANDEWKSELQARIHAAFDDAEETKTGDQSILDGQGISTGPEATETGLMLIDAAFDRIRYS